MPFASATLYSTQSNSNYSMVNDLIGQLKTLLLNDPKITVISDNNPGTGATARVIILKVGSSLHYLKFLPISTTAIASMLLNLDGSTNVVTPTNWVGGFLNNCATSYAYSANLSAIHFGNYTYAVDVVYILDSTGHFWCIFNQGINSGYAGYYGWYCDSSNNQYSFYQTGSSSPNTFSDSGYIMSPPLLPIDATTGEYFDTVTIPTAYQFNIPSLNMVNLQIYEDGNGQYGYWSSSYVLYHE